ncbi:hypothetical protein F5144DRAFT_497412 [Chaetomium tenue]|uniref:Uncharacterized protein n=1 Tax=Chaetomium tenue TaxID=1854479 RepID=A0ACB7NYD5_9PEZI|nr:hypothetical protein F5144DRAFT_497412 [Chaetomium globosum]
MDVLSWSDTEILEATRKKMGKNLASTDEERSKLRFRMDTESEEKFVAVVIEFGDGGAVIVDGMIEIGQKSNKELHFASSAWQFSGRPRMYYIHQE